MKEGMLGKYADALGIELQNLLYWWKTFAVDHERGGFYGEVQNDNLPLKGQPKGLVLNSRILWTFSSAYLLNHLPDDLLMAKRAFEYLCDFFYDHRYGGFYWSVDAGGNPLDRKKQIYGQAFAIYGLSEYFKATNDTRALNLAKETFGLIEQYSLDPIHEGYTEAFSADWSPIDDLRLSEKDLNTAKSMNTHLHIIEAYANLYAIWSDMRLGGALKKLLIVFKTHLIGSDFHQQLFFSKNWESQSAIISYGHDIEAAWLLQACAESLGDEEEINTFKQLAIAMTDAVMDGVDSDGGMYYEYNPENRLLVREKHWWPQAEAMIGFFNAYELSENKMYLNRSMDSWNFVKETLRDGQNGEWYWGVHTDGSLMPGSKAGFWKCPYHNGRACMELIKRMNGALKI